MSQHTHTLPDGTVITHEHPLNQDHDGAVHEEHASHHHNTKAVINRMNRAIGHMESIKTMIEHDRDSTEVLVQIAAVRSAINNIGKIILEEHIHQCLADAAKTGNQESLRELNDAINKFVK